jgi:hypothetical protein
MKGRKFATSSRKVVPILIGEQGYVIQEMTGSDRSEFLNKMSENRLRIDVGNNTETRIQRLGDLELDILLPCLYYAEVQEFEEHYKILKILDQVPPEVIAQLPASIVVELAKEAREVNGLGGKAGND